MYGINSETNDTEASKQIFGTLSLNHKLYRPRLYNLDDFIESAPIDITTRYNDSQLPVPLYQNINNNEINSRFNSIPIKEIDYNKYRTINEDGSIKVLKQWVIQFTWEIYVNEYKNINTDSSIKEKEFKKSIINEIKKKMK